MRALDYFFLLRPTLFFAGLTIFLLALFPAVPPLPHLATVIVFQAVIYLYNQLHDIETDRLNGKLFFLADGLIEAGKARLFYRLLLALFAGLLFFCSTPFGLVMVTALVLLNYLYSHPRLNWKGRPYLSCLAAFLGGALGWLCGALSRQTEWELTLLSGMLPSALAVTAAALLGMLLDAEGDRTAGKLTLAVHLGRKNSARLVLAVTIGGLLLSLWQSELFFAAAFLASLLCQLFCRHRTDLQLKAPILVLSLGASWCYPWYLALIVGYFCLARLYFKKRFGLNYP